MKLDMMNTADMGEERGSTGLTTVSERHAKSSWETPGMTKSLDAEK
jgi:hypothetical protein